MPESLLAVVYVLRNEWSALEGKTAATLAELDEAERVGEALVRAIGTRDRTPASMIAARDDLRRAFTLFVRLYQELRAAVLYVRRKEGDGERLFPTIYGGRRKRAKRKASESAAPASAGDATPAASGRDGAGHAPDGVPTVRVREPLLAQ